MGDNMNLVTNIRRQLEVPEIIINPYRWNYMPVTIEQIYKDKIEWLREQGVLNVFFKNLHINSLRYGTDAKEYIARTHDSLISSAFSWYNTDEGHSFWYGVNKNYILWLYINPPAIDM